MKQMLVLLTALTAAPASGAGIYLCGDMSSDEYSLVFQEKGAPRGMLLVPGSEGSDGALQIKCVNSDAEDSDQLCEPELPIPNPPAIAVNLRQDRVRVSRGPRTVQLPCGEVE